MLKFTPLERGVQVDLDLTIENGERKLTISVQDNGDGLDSIIITQIMDSHASSIKRASDEKAYGEHLDWLGN